MARLFFLFVASFMVALQRGSIQWLVALIVLWTLSTVFLRALLLRIALYFSPNLNVFNYLPISNEDIFKVQWGKFLRGSLWSVVEFTILYSVLAARMGVSVSSVAIGIALGLIQSIFVIGMAVCLLVLGWRKVFDRLAHLFMASTFGLLFFLSNKQSLSEWLSSLAYWIPPVGWLVHAMGITPSKGLLHDLWPCLISGAILALFPFAYRHLRCSYALGEQRIAMAHRATATGLLDQVEFPEMAGRFTQPAPEVAAVVRSGELKVGLDWPHLPLVERFIGRMLTERERGIADSLVAGNPQWTAGVRSLASFLGLALAGCWLFTPQFKASFVSLLSFGAVYLLAVFAGQWRGFAFPRGGGAQSPFYALYPLGFWELMCLILKVNFVRSVCWVLFIFGALLLVRGSLHLALGGLDLAWGSAIRAVIKFLILGLIAQPLLAIAQVSPGTNDGQKPRVILAAIIFIVVFVASAITFFIATTFQVMVVAGAISAGASTAALLLYGRYFNNNRFDLVPTKIVRSALQ